MDQFEKMILNRRDSIRISESAMRNMVADKNVNRIFANFNVFIKDHFEIALLRWRRGESPVADMMAALDWANKTVAAIAEWQPDIDVFLHNPDWTVFHYPAYLLNRSIGLPDDIWQTMRRRQTADAADLGLDFLLLDALNDRPYRDYLPQQFARLASKKRQALSVQTYQIYFALIDAGGDIAAIEPLVRQAETNYIARARDPFFFGGVSYEGGGPNNPYVVDFMLAAILKKIGWEGESLHRWRWG